jgi:hypothetical protein
MRITSDDRIRKPDSASIAPQVLQQYKSGSRNLRQIVAPGRLIPALGGATHNGDHQRFDLAGFQGR